VRAREREAKAEDNVRWEHMKKRTEGKGQWKVEVRAGSTGAGVQRPSWSGHIRSATPHRLGVTSQHIRDLAPVARAGSSPSVPSHEATATRALGRQVQGAGFHSFGRGVVRKRSRYGRKRVVLRW
jgi:hypothetical protein